VRLDGTPYPRELERAVIVGAPPPEITVSPTGPVSAATPFDVVVQSAEDLDVDAGVGAVTEPARAEVPVEVVRPDDRTVTLRVLRALSETGPIRLLGSLRTRWTGYVFPLSELRYAPSRVPVTFLSPLHGSFSTAPVRLQVRVDHPVGAPVTVWAECSGIVRTVAVIAESGAHAVTWDPGDAPDGPCTLRAEAEGWFVATGPSFRLDRVPPVVTRCLSDGNIRGGVRIELDPDAPDPADTSRARVSATGPKGAVALGVREQGPGYLVVGIDARFEPPGDVTFELAPFADAAGNIGGGSCTVSYPGWWQALEWPAVDLATGGIRPGSLSIARRGLTILLAWIDSDGLGWTARVRDGRPADLAPVAPGVPISQVLVGVDSSAWIERPVGGPPAVRVGSARIERGRESDPRELTLSVLTAAWTETDADGHARIAYAPLSLATAAYAPSSAGSAARSPTLAESFLTWMSWVEEEAGAPPRLRTWFVGAASPASPALDPLAGASTPSMYANHLVWDEGGRVLMTAVFGEPGGIVWNDPQVMSAPGVAARAPIIAGGTPSPTALWLERSASGDRLAWSHWEGAGVGWRAPSVEGFDLPAGGAIAFSRADPAVAWVDAAGTVHVAASNVD
jgi:hypothetical protein